MSEDDRTRSTLDLDAGIHLAPGRLRGSMIWREPGLPSGGARL